LYLHEVSAFAVFSSRMFLVVAAAVGRLMPGLAEEVGARVHLAAGLPGAGLVGSQEAVAAELPDRFHEALQRLA
jgi:hypothetical protein